LTAFKNYLSLIKFSHSIFAMPFAFIGFFVGIMSLPKIPNVYYNLVENKSAADKILLYLHYNGYLLLLVIGCMIFARSAAMAFNRYLDAGFDEKNPRTAVREIPAGILKANHVLLFTIISCIAFIACCYFINSICFYLSPVALFVVLFYSYTKRFTALCHLVLGVGLSLAPIGAYLSVTGKFDLLPILFSVAVLCWVSGFDIIYALQDESFDKKNQLHSIPAALGKKNALRASVALHILSTLAVVYAGWYGHFGILYGCGILLFSALLVYQHWLVKPNDLSKVNLAFFTTNGIASVLFAGFVIADLFLTHPGPVQ